MQNFKDLPLSPALLKSVEEMGFSTPTPIQAQALPMLLEGPTDFLGLAATGTGKTAAYAIPMLEKIDTSVKAVQALILCPTRELAVQVSGQINLLGKYQGLKAVAVYGGASYTDQIHGLKRGAQIVVGTPGRVIDHLERGTLLLNDIKVLILDEADEMISMGFAEDMEMILEKIPRETSNTWLFSATMNHQVSRVASKYLVDPKKVQINKTEMLSDKVEQLYYPVRENDKPEVLCKLIDAAENFYGVIFCQTKALVADLHQYLNERGYKADSLHGDKDQTARERTLQAFRDRRVSILICTDVASRGIDVKDITHVVNYSLPRELDNYVHRIGRTARSGKTGIAMNLVSPMHRRLVFAIEKFTNSRMKEGQIPTRKDIGIKKVSQLLPSFADQPFASRAQSVLSEEWRESLAGLSTEEVAARFLTMMMPDLFNERNQDIVNSPRREDRREQQERKFEGRRGGYDRGPRQDGGDRPQRKFDGRPRFNREERGENAERPRYNREERGEQTERPRFKREERGESSDRPAYKPRYEKSASATEGNREERRYPKRDFKREDGGGTRVRDRAPFKRGHSKGPAKKFAKTPYSKNESL